MVYSSTTADRYYATNDGLDGNASYVGWTYSLGSQRTLSGTASNAKKQTEIWYTNNLASYANKIEDGKFCNDRNMTSGSSFPNGGTEKASRKYAAYGRLIESKSPTLNCPDEDVYTLKIGAITADEVAYAGGVYTRSNKSYYLKGNNAYWTMSPSNWSGIDAAMFAVSSDSFLNEYGLNNTNVGLRPVINLKADTIFAAGGTGEQDSPYIVN